LIIDYFLLIIFNILSNNQLSLINNHSKATPCDRVIFNCETIADLHQQINLFSFFGRKTPVSALKKRFLPKNNNCSKINSRTVPKNRKEETLRFLLL